MYTGQADLRWMGRGLIKMIRETEKRRKSENVKILTFLLQGSRGQPRTQWVKKQTPPLIYLSYNSQPSQWTEGSAPWCHAHAKTQPDEAANIWILLNQRERELERVLN